MKFVCFIFLSILVLDGCAFNSPEIGKDQENFSNFFLCFPEIDEGFSQLNMKEQLELRKEIAEEKIKRNFDCSQFSNFVSIKENVDKISLTAVHATPETLTHDTERPVQLQEHVMLHFPKRPHKTKSPDLRLKIESMSTSSQLEDNHNVLRDDEGHDHDYITFGNSPSHSHTRNSRDRMEVPDRKVKKSTELSKISESLHVHSLNGHRGDEISSTPSMPSKVKRRMRWELDVRVSLSLSFTKRNFPITYNNNRYHTRNKAITTFMTHTNDSFMMRSRILNTSHI